MNIYIYIYINLACREQSDQPIQRLQDFGWYNLDIFHWCTKIYFNTQHISTILTQ